MQVSANTVNANPFLNVWNHLKKPESKVTVLAASILLGSLYMGYQLLPLSTKLGQAVMVVGASAGWGIFFSYH